MTGAFVTLFVVWFSAVSGHDDGTVTARTCAAALAAAEQVARNGGLRVVSARCEGGQ